MSPSTVEWTDDALDELAALWLKANDPDRVTAAQATIASAPRRALSV